jgi:hypothetical protein
MDSRHADESVERRVVAGFDEPTRTNKQQIVTSTPYCLKDAQISARVELADHTGDRRLQWNVSGRHGVDTRESLEIRSVR